MTTADARYYIQEDSEGRWHVSGHGYSERQSDAYEVARRIDADDRRSRGLEPDTEQGLTARINCEDWSGRCPRGHVVKIVDDGRDAFRACTSEGCGFREFVRTRRL